MEYIKTICTKSYLFVQQHYVTVMRSSLVHLNKRKKITRCFKVRWNWYTQFHRLDTKPFQSIFSFVYHPGASWGSLSCRLYFLIFSWLSYLLPKTAMEILRKYKRQIGEDSAGRVFFHWFCTSVFPTSNLTSSQRPIFKGNWRPKSHFFGIPSKYLR